MATRFETRLPLAGSGYFLDSGNLEEIQAWKDVIGGVTTNQIILFEKQRVRNIPMHLSAMCEIVGDGVPISVELPDSSWSAEELLTFARRYHDAHPTNTVIKVPILPDDVKGLHIVHALVREGIRTNATIGLTFGQLTLAAEAARAYAGEGATYISIFWGRTIESVEQYQEGVHPNQLLEATLTYLTTHALDDTRVIVGSIREPAQVIDAFSHGADIVTVPESILRRMLQNRRAQETVREFDEAFRRVQQDIQL